MSTEATTETHTLDIHGAAKLLDVHPQTVRMWVRYSKLPALRVGRVYRFAEAELRAWQTARTTRIN